MPLRVNVWHGKDDDSVYRRGEKVRVRFEANQDAYAVVYRIDAEGLVTILWPRSRYDDGFVFGHHEYKLPQSGGTAIRASEEEGVEYIEAVMSSYPFDLRELKVDFLHEQGDEALTLYVAGDPFLAMNEVNYAVTGLDDPEDYVVTNYTSYFVHRQVEHPRYLCAQCHTDGVEYQPYRSTCTVDIHYDYEWSNRWYVRFGYFPVYYYPAYYYVDPWTGSPWINYWYRPWYRYPSYSVYHWPHRYWYWNDSPYYYGDCYTRGDSGNRRYQPINRRDAGERLPYRIESAKGGLIAATGPGERVKDAMRTKTKVDARRPESARGAHVKSSGSDDRYRNVNVTKRDKAVFRGETRTRVRPGLVIRDGRRPSAQPKPAGVRGASERSRPTIDAGRRSSPQSEKPVLRSRDTSRRDAARGGSSSGSIRTVEPRNKTSQIWNGNRSSSGATKVKAGGSSSSGTSSRSDRPSRVKPSTQKSSPKSTSKATNVRSSSRGSSGSAVRGSRSSGSSKSSGGGSKKSSSSKKKG